MHEKLIQTLTMVAICGLLGMSNVNAESATAIVIHGGAGTITRSSMSAEKEAQIRAVLQQSLEAGYQQLQAGADSTTAVIAAINIMEDSPLFNAGKGAVFDAEGKNQMDASIMEGAKLNAGAVASVSHIKNPIDLALKVMTNSDHVMLMGEGAEEFAREQGFEMMDPQYFYTEFRWDQLQRIKARETAAQADEQTNIERAGVEKVVAEKAGVEQSRAAVSEVEKVSKDEWFSTVGAVALDKKGNLAAGTSTGGTANKQFGRVGDSPIIGAGTYANNASCAVSATGHGEYFIRYVVAYNICSRVENGTPLADAADIVVNDVLVKAQGEGGVISMDAAGNIATPFNSEGMYRASIDTSGKMTISIYRNEGDSAAFNGTVEH